ncbi:MAG: hypothetical protein R3F49_14970 [Planctomycetota bacterium]
MSLDDPPLTGLEPGRREDSARGVLSRPAALSSSGLPASYGAPGALEVAPGATEVGGGDDSSALQRAIAEALGGFEVLDRQLALSGATDAPATAPGAASAADADPSATATVRPVDLVGVGPTGRLVLVLILQEAERELALERALDLVARTQEQRPLLERHFNRSLPASAPLVVLVGTDSPVDLVRRIGAIGFERILALEVRELRSAAGVTTWIAPLQPRVALDGAASLRAFVASLDPAIGALANVLDERLKRLDGGLAVLRTPDGLDWRWRGRSVCSVAPRGQHLEGRVHVDGVARARPMDDAAAVEGFLDAALARVLALGDELDPALS